MPTITVSKEVWVEVDVDVDLEDFDDEDLIEELEERGYAIAKDEGEDDQDFGNVAWLLSINKTEEALIQLERIAPQLVGIKDIIKKAGVV